MSAVPKFDERPILLYLQLPESSYLPSPTNSPVEFLTKHVRELPPHLLQQFSMIVTPKDRTNVSVIRNRRLRYTMSDPAELEFTEARSTWPTLWPGRERRGQAEAEDENDWVSKAFLTGETKHVGNLGALLAGYEEEREAERVRVLRREAAPGAFVPEEDSESDSDSEDGNEYGGEEESPEEIKADFCRLIRDRFIFGLLDQIDYDAVDWNDNLDVDDDREAEERWFEEDDED